MLGHHYELLHGIALSEDSLLKRDLIGVEYSWYMHESRKHITVIFSDEFRAELIKMNYAPTFFITIK